MNKINELSDAAFYLEKTSILLIDEAQRIDSHLNLIRNNLHNGLSFVEIENSLETIVNLVNWIDHIQRKVECVKRQIINETFH